MTNISLHMSPKSNATFFNRCGKYTDLELYKRLASYLIPFKGRFIISLLASIPSSAMNGMLAFLLGPFLDSFLKEQNYQLLMLVPVVVISASLIQSVFEYISDYYANYVGNAMCQTVRFQLFQRLGQRDLGYFKTNTSGDLVTRYYSDPGWVQTAVIAHFQGIIMDVSTAVILAGVLFYRNWQLAVIAIAVISATALPLSIISKKIRKQDHVNQQAAANVLQVLNQYVLGSRMIMAFQLHQHEEKRFQTALHNFFTAVMRITKANLWLRPIMQMVAACGVAIITFVGSMMVQSGTMTPGDLASFLVALVLLYKPAKSLGMAYGKLQRILAPMERIMNKLDLPPLLKEAQNAKTAATFKTLTFENVTFAYEEDKPVLNDVSFTLNAGETLALVGPSGGGKSTLVDLIPRFMDPELGSVKINGTDLRELSFDSLRKLIAIVPQDTTLFDGSIRDNIVVGKLDATDEMIQRALKAAYLDEWVSTLPQGLETPVGEWGGFLSGGQKQRIAIARAFLRDAPILILDEATSSLDNESEAMVQNALRDLQKGRTVIVIAHRLSTIQIADRILVLQNGQIVESGTHDVLIKNNGLYKKLYNLQFRENAELLEMGFSGTASERAPLS